MCSLVCGCSGSTSGGIKIDRVLLALKGVRKKVGLSLNPRLVQVIRVDGVIRPYEQVSDAFGYIFCYLFIVAVGAAINIAFGLCKLYVPAESIDLYRVATTWMDFDIQPMPATAIENIQNGNVQTTKALRNGHLLIEHNGHIYNVQGARVK